MDKDKLNYYKNRLIEEKNSTLKTVDTMNEESNKALKESTDELSVYDNHPADIGSETYMMEQSMNLKNNEELIIKQIDIALEKIKNGTYGRCEICGDEMDLDRLDIIPYVKTCLNCRDDKLPMNDMNNQRPAEEDNLKYPFGRTNKDHSQEEYVGTDGEDISQSLYKFNQIKNDPSLNTGDDVGVYDEKEAGIVEDVEKISNDFYKGQLENEDRKDIPDRQKKQ
ncbi:MAG: molecular chaperone DnaK [Firmicutes bacterium]|nr:molecular chaperone DnaK [Bacillota bacterium]